ncbi:H-NS histone family protein [Epibacterium sp. Ofav1-8]|uniref:H-NS histone family protein n=1 Tax=Epibacterium sp. Ofav1-8 TaxID=2917735 RepID=UPI001EF471BC|nr:H-NS histone family protein [Epibacterium sp. Ofav1-8]MCG7625937.1 H-NS histone family protein [Epibacterium sp. Ofav1-8]
MEIDLKQYRKSELEDLANEIKKELDDKLKTDTQNALSEMIEVAQKYELPFADVIEMHRKKSRKKPEPGVTYRNPHDPNQTWSGRGRRPAWIRELLNQGVTLEDLTA